MGFSQYERASVKLVVFYLYVSDVMELLIVREVFLLNVFMFFKGFLLESGKLG